MSQMHNILDPEANGPQQQKTTSDFMTVSKEQDSEATARTVQCLN